MKFFLIMFGSHRGELDPLGALNSLPRSDWAIAMDVRPHLCHLIYPGSPPDSPRHSRRRPLSVPTCLACETSMLVGAWGFNPYFFDSCGEPDLIIHLQLHHLCCSASVCFSMAYGDGNFCLPALQCKRCKACIQLNSGENGMKRYLSALEVV